MSAAVLERSSPTQSAFGPRRRLSDEPSEGNPHAALLVAVLGFFVVTLDALVVNVALPSIGSDLGGGITGLQWVVDGYTLMFAALLLSAGALSDRIGARRVLGIGLTMFIAASVACGFSPHIGLLVAARLAQGAGAALILAASLALIREGYANGRERARAIAIWSLGAAVASSAGPVVGGFLTLLSWRIIFFINLPIGVVALYLLMRVRRSSQRPAPLDWLGQMTAIVGMGALTYGLIEGGAMGFDSPSVLAALALAMLAVIAFFAFEARGAHPMLPLDLFRSRPVAVSVSVGFTFTIAFYGLVFLLSLYLQELRGLSPLATGLTFVPMTGLTAFVTLVVPRAAARFGPRMPIALGQLLIAAGLLTLILAVALQAPVLLLALLTIPVGFGSALAIPTITALLVGSVPADRAGTASGVLNTCRQLGSALAVAVSGALVAHRETFAQGMQLSLLIAAVLLLVTTAASLKLKKGVRINDSIDQRRA
jgi:DHA2 family methylenomycin A resistance protein-like MFS transporter